MRTPVDVIKIRNTFQKMCLSIAAILAFSFMISENVPVLAQTGTAISSVTLSDATPEVGDQITATININLSGVDAPDNALGSYTGTLNWNTAVLAYESHSGAPPSGFTGAVNTGDIAAGLITFNGANASGATENVIVLNVTFNVISSGTSDLDLNYTAMAAAGTFNSLLENLSVNDGEVTATEIPSGIVILDGAVSSGTADDVSSISITHTSGTGINRLMLVGVSWNCGSTNQTITSVSFTPSGGNAMALTNVITQQAGTQLRYSAIYNLTNPPVGTSGTITITFSGSVGNGIVAGVANYAGVDQVTPLGTAVGTGSTSQGTTPSVTLSELNGKELIFDNVFQGASGSSQTLTAGNDQTQLWNDFLGSVRAASSTKQAISSSVTMSWTASSSAYWAIAAVPINPASAGLTFTLSMVSNPLAGGTTNPLTGTYSYEENEVVEITATPAAGYEFVNWTGSSVTDDNSASTTVTLNENKTITANFVQQNYTLTVNADTHGSVTLDPPGETFASGTIVKLTPVPGSGYQFSNWSGANASDIINTDGIYTIVMNGIKTIGAEFSEISGDITVSMEAIADAYMNSGSSRGNYNYGGDTLLQTNPYYQSGGSHQYRGMLLKWDVSGIPANAVVTAASITFFVKEGSTYAYNLYNLKREWIEGTNNGASGTGASWNYYGAGSGSWGSAGAQNTSSDRDDINLWDVLGSMFESTGIVTIPLNANGIQLVNDWIAGNLENFGLTIQNYSGTSGDPWIVASRENGRASGPVLNITYTESTDPVITVSNISLADFSTQPGIPSTPETYTVSGNNLTDNIAVTAPAGFEISTDGSIYSSSLTLLQSGGTVSATTIYVRLNNGAEGTFSGNISHTSTGAATVNTAVSGIVASTITTSLSVAEDTWMRSSQPDQNWGGSTTIQVSPRTDYPQGSLYLWDISGIPAGATVTSVSLTFNVTEGSEYAFSLYNMRQKWIEGSNSGTAGTGASWTYYGAGTGEWGSGGAANTTSDRYNTNLLDATANDFRNTGIVTFPLNANGITVVQEWINGTTENFGLTMQNYSGGSSSDYWIVSSSEDAVEANRPKMNITYATTEDPIITTTGTLNAFSSPVNSPSSEQSYQVAGSRLNGPIVITPPADFEISLTSGSGFSSSPLSLPPTGGTIPATTIFVRFNRTTAGTTSGNITHTSENAATLSVAVSGTAGFGWTAYNDGAYIDGQISTHITTYEGYTNGASGLLVKYADGSNTPVTVTVKTSGTVDEQISSDYYGAEANAGTDAYTTFHDYVNMVGGIRLGSSDAYVELTFTGLSPSNTYTFATSANRANSEYTDRITSFEISDADAAINASTSGVTVTDNQHVSFCTGYNTENGYVARWTGVNAGTDGDFTVRFSVTSGTYAYGPAVFLLKEESGEIPEQYTLTIGNDANGHVDVSPSGSLYYEGTTVTLTPVANSGYQFANWSGENAADPASQGNNTWSLLINGNKSLYANFTVLTTNVTPNPPNLVMPTDGATGISIAPDLQVTVSDPNTADALDVNFYGRLYGEGQPAEDFVIVVIPDPQNFASSGILYNGEMNWIADNKTSLNIQYVLCVGDLVNSSSSTQEYTNADIAFDILDAANVPYSVVPGNHDMSMGTTLFPDYFGISRFSVKDWYGGSLDNYNTYSFFSEAGNDFLVINLQYNPGTTQTDWADNLLKTYPDRRGIVVQHNILNIDNSWNSQASYTALRDNPNLFMMVCGHMHSASDGAAYVAGTGTDDHTIHVILADYQDMSSANYLRLLRFSSSDDMIYMTTYAPSNGTAITTSPDQMDLVYDLANNSTASEYELIGTVDDVENGANASVTWPGLDPSQQYEWYTTVSDGNLTTTGTVWSFTTTDGVAYTLSVDSNGNGSVTLNPAGSNYAPGTQVTMTPTPQTGNQFNGWTGGDASDIVDEGSGVYSIVMNGDKSVTADFIPMQFTLAINIEGNGSIIKNPDNTYYNYNQEVILTAVPETGHTFVNWTGDVTESDNTTITVTMDESKSITAHFAPFSATQNIVLLNGWNIFSLNIVPQEDDMIDLLQSLIDANALVKVQDEVGGALEMNPVTGIWINDIGNWSITEGYKIKVNQNIELTITGTPIPAPVSIDLESGWNIMSFPSNGAQNAQTVLDELINSELLVKVQNEAGNAIERNPATGHWIDDIGDFEPGEGYKINVSGDASLVVDYVITGVEIALKSARVKSHNQSVTTHFKPLWNGNGLDHMNIYLSESKNSIAGLQSGDEIGVFDGNNCVGAGLIEDPFEPMHSIVVSADDPTTVQTDGFVKGNPLSLKIWRSANNDEESLTSLEFIPGTSRVYEPMGTSMIKWNGESVGLNTVSNDYTGLGNSYPNPFNTTTTIPFTIGEEAAVDIAIYNILGARIQTLVHGTLSPGDYTASWDITTMDKTVVMPGIYLCKMTAGDKVSVIRIEVTEIR